MSQLLSVTIAILMLGLTALPSFAQANAFAASIVSGDCSSDAVVAELTGLELPTGPQIGAQDGRTAASSFTAVPVSFNQLTASAHSIQAGDSCGPIGGAVNSAGALIVVLSGENGDSGIAYLSPNAANPGQTDVSLFLAPSTVARDIAEPSTDGGSVDAQAAIQADLTEQAADVADAPAPAAETDVTETGLTAEEQVYLDSITEIIANVSESLVEFQELAADPLFLNEDWRIRLAAVVVVWQISYDEVLQLNAPASLSEFHINFTEALRLLSSAGDDILLGIDSVDPALIDQGAAKIQEGTTYLDVASRLLDELIASRGE